MHKARSSLRILIYVFGAFRYRAASSLRPATLTRVIAFHKPAGLLTTHRDDLARETVYERLIASLPKELAAEEWHACGRLDKETTGLICFTNDGRLLKHTTDPSAGSEPLIKTYRCLVHALDDEALQMLREGVDLGGGLGFSRPAKVELESRERKAMWIRISIGEGKNRQVRRMLHSVGSGVMKMQRVSIGGLELGELEEGGWRLLTEDEVMHSLGYAPRHLRPYTLLDCGNGKRLETFAGRTVVRLLSLFFSLPQLPLI